MDVVQIVELIQEVWGFVLAAAGITSVLVLILGGLKNIRSKKTGIYLVKDNTADVWLKGMQLFSLLGITALKLFKPEIDLAILNTFAADLAHTYGALAVIVLPFMARFGDFLYQAGLREVPFVGKSRSAG